MRKTAAKKEFRIGKNPADEFVADFTIIPERVSGRLMIVASLLFIINLTGIYLEKVINSTSFFTNAVVFFFDASLEGNIPTLFSALILFFAAVLLWIIYRLSGKEQPGHRKYWLLLSMVFIFLMVDEAATVHEQFNKLRVFNSTEAGYLKYMWILPYMFFVVVGAIFFRAFLWTLPARTRTLFIFSGLVYVIAALGFEPFEGRISVIYGTGHLYDKLLCSIEEFLEMGGIILFIYALLDYIPTQTNLIRIKPAGTPASGLKNE